MMAELTAKAWNEYISGYDGVHLLQTAEWGDLKSRFGWRVERVAAGEAGAQILFRKTPLGLTAAYLPKGPVGSDWDALWPEVFETCRKMRAVFLRVEPDAPEGSGVDTAANFPGFAPGSRSIQPRRTVIVDLSGGEEDWLARMKQKTRYNIRLSEKKGVYVNLSGDVEKFAQMMKTTGERDGFGVHSLAYYRAAYELFSPSGRCALLEACYEGRSLAMVMVFAHSGRGYYLYGASGNEERNRMPAYKIQWEAMKWCAERGCKSYDLYGVPDCGEEELEEGFETRSDGLWGVYRFKRGFGGQVVRSAAPREKIFMPAVYRIFRLIERHD